MDYDTDATEERAPLAGMLDVGLMLDSTREGALVTDEHDTVLDANLAACVLFGRSRAELIGRRLDDLGQLTAVAFAVGRKPRSEPPRTTPHEGDITVRRPDGTTRCLEIRARANVLPGRHISIVRDATPRQRLEKRAALSLAVARAVAEGALPLVTLARILGMVGGALEWNAAYLWSPDKRTGTLRCIGEWTRNEADAERLSSVSRVTELSPGQGLAGRALHTCEPTFMADGAASALGPRSAAAAHDGIRSGVAYPIRLVSEVVTVVELFSREDRPPDDDTVLALESIGPAVGQLVERMRWNEAEQSWQGERGFAAGGLAAIEHASFALLRAVTTQEIADVARADAAVALGAQGAALYLLTARGDALERVGAPPSGHAKEERIAVDDPGPLGRAVRSGQPLFLENVMASEHAAARERSGALALVPVLAGGNLVAVLEWSFAAPRDFPPRDRSVLLSLARLCALTFQAVRERDRAAALQKEEASGKGERQLQDDFLSILSHELRTPLQAIIGWTGLLRQGKLDPGVARGIETIARNANKQAETIEHLIDVSRMASGKVELTLGVVDVHRAVQAAVESVATSAASKGVTVTHALADVPLYVKGDAHRLRQVFTNLLSNAVKFNRDGGTVEVHAERSGQDVVISVSDTGKGISKEMLARVFGRFWQADSSTRRAHGGLGLGLSIVRYLVELHGGVVRAESAGEDRGTTLVVTLPVPAAAPATVASTLESGGRAPRPAEQATPDVRNGLWPADDRLEGDLLAPRPLAGRRVLIVDANADDCDLLCTALRASGAETRAAGDAHRALAAFDAFRPDVIVCDVAVPDLDGCGLVRRVRSGEHAPRIPLIALTAASSNLEHGPAVASGFDAQVSKPVNLVELVSVVSALHAT